MNNLVCKYCLSKKKAFDFVRPCLCKGTIATVHQKCLYEYLKTKKLPRCEICNTDYKFVYQKTWNIHYIFDWITLIFDIIVKFVLYSFFINLIIFILLYIHADELSQQITYNNIIKNSMNWITETTITLITLFVTVFIAINIISLTKYICVIKSVIRIQENVFQAMIIDKIIMILSIDEETELNFGEIDHEKFTISQLFLCIMIIFQHRYLLMKQIVRIIFTFVYIYCRQNAKKICIDIFDLYHERKYMRVVDRSKQN